MRLEEIRATHSIQSVLGWPDRKKWGLCVLPQHVHGSNTPSFSIYPWQGKQLFKCHGNCGGKGDVIDLIGYLEIPGYNHDKRDYLRAAKILSSGNFQVHPPVVIPTPPQLPQWLWQEMLPPSKAVIDYALSRGLTMEQIKKFKLGTPTQAFKKRPYEIFYPEQWMSIPTFQDGELIGIKLRNITQHEIRYLNLAGSRKGLFNYDAVADETGPVIIAKGEIAAMVLDRFGFTACAPTGGEGSYINDVKGALALSQNLLIGDNDADPETKAKMRAFARKRARDLDALLKYPPEEFKDIDAWLLARPEEATQTIQEWLEELNVRSQLKASEDNIQKLQERILELEAEVEQLNVPIGKFEAYEEYELPKLDIHAVFEPAIYKEQYQRDLERAERNEARLVHNAELSRSLLEMIEATGLPKKVYTYPNRRSYTKKWVEALWISGIQAACPRLSYKKSDIEQIWEHSIKERNKLEAQRSAEEIQQNEFMAISKVAMLLGMDTAKDLRPEDIVAVLRERDKYLDLAIAMENSQKDNSNGFYRVGQACDRFHVETETDEKIVCEISLLLNSPEEDGRVFRDCKYNYNVLFTKVDSTILEYYDEIWRFLER